jgi:hypothetical protein
VKVNHLRPACKAGTVNGVVRGAIVAAAFSLAVPASAQAPLSPVRLPTQPSGPQQWIEPPPAPVPADAAENKSTTPGSQSAPVATAPIPPARSATEAAENTAPAVAPEPPPAEAADSGDKPEKTAAPAAAAAAPETPPAAPEPATETASGAAPDDKSKSEEKPATRTATAAEPGARPARDAENRRRDKRSRHSAKLATRSRTTAGRLNRRELARIRTGIPSYATSYYPYYYSSYRYSPSPNGDTGN